MDDFDTTIPSRWVAGEASPSQDKARPKVRAIVRILFGSAIALVVISTVRGCIR
jgi:hypothetical protein